MAGPHRTPPHLVELIEQLRDKPYAFDFFQAVRLLDCAQPQLPQTGHSATPKDEPFRITQEVSATFAPATISGFEPETDISRPRLVQRFLGLFGPQGPMPMHLTEFVYSRIYQKRDYTFSRFADIFHHRLASLFYRTWARVRPTVNFDDGSRDRFGEYVAAVFGLGMPSLTDRDAMPDLPKRHFSGFLSCQTKHAEGLLAMLEGYFRLPVDLEQLVGQWIELPDDCICRIGSSPSVSCLGKSMTIGSHVWDCQQKFRVVLGPLDADDFYNFLPIHLEKQSEHVADGGSQGPCADTVYVNAKFYVGDETTPWVQAVAVRDGKILALGDLIAIDQVTASTTQVVDLGGACVLPNLQLLTAGSDGDASSQSTSECQLLPKPSNQWANLEAAFRKAQSVAAKSSATSTDQQVLETAIRQLSASTVANDPSAALIQLGGTADLLAVDQNLFELVASGQVDRIRDTRILRVIFDGQLVYDLAHDAEDMSPSDALLRTRLIRTSASTAQAIDESMTPAQESSSITRDPYESPLSVDAYEGPSADTVLLNGKICAPDSVAASADAVAILDGKILAVGTATAIDATVGPATKVFDLNGASVLPDMLLLDDRSVGSIGNLKSESTECRLYPQPSERWSTLEATYRRRQRDANASAEADDEGDGSDALSEASNSELLKQAIWELIPERDADEDEVYPALTVGAPADLLIVNQDIFDAVERDEVARIRDTQVERVVFDGEIVYERAGPIENSPRIAAMLPQRQREDDRQLADSNEPRQDAGARGDLESNRVSLDRLVALVRSYVGDQLAWDAQLILKRDETPPLGLGMHTHLGWTSWLLRNHIDRDPDDLILDAMAVRNLDHNQEQLHYQPMDQWDQSVLGQNSDGSLMLATADQPAPNESRLQETIHRP